MHARDDKRFDEMTTFDGQEEVDTKQKGQSGAPETVL
jgi:hypothetical protein